MGGDIIFAARGAHVAGVDRKHGGWHKTVYTGWHLKVEVSVEGVKRWANFSNIFNWMRCRHLLWFCKDVFL